MTTTNDSTPPTGPVLEIVTYRLTEGADAEAHAAAAAGMAPFLDRVGGAAWRRLTVDGDGLWTDVIQWRDMEAAQAAAAQIGAAPEAAAFIRDIDGPTVAMRHARVAATMG